MIRALFRLLGLLLLAGGFILLIYDGARSIADKTVKIYKFSEAWSDLNQSSLIALQPAIERHAGAWLWDPVIVTLLAQPVWLVLGLVGIVLLLLGRKKK